LPRIVEDRDSTLCAPAGSISSAAKLPFGSTGIWRPATQTVWPAVMPLPCTFHRAAAQRNLLARQVILAIGGQQLALLTDPVGSRELSRRWPQVQVATAARSVSSKLPVES